jgi:hypothetical protein
MKPKQPESSFWMKLISRNGYPSHSKMLAILGALVASGVMVYETVHLRMNSDYFWAYLGILVAGNAASKFIETKGGKNAPTTTHLLKE